MWDFRHLVQMADPDRVIIRLPATGLLGAFGAKKEIVIRRSRTPEEEMELVHALLRCPIWAIERGVTNEIEQEIWRWQFLELARFGLL